MSLKKLGKSFYIGFAGIYFALIQNQTLDIGFVIAILVIAAGFIFHLSLFEFIAVLILIVMVLCAEMTNTAIEEVVNLLVNEHKKEAKIAKDVAAGMVVLTILLAGVVGIIIFLPHVLHFLLNPELLIFSR